MALRGRPSTVVSDASDYEAATALAKKIAGDLAEAKSNLADLDERLDAAALDLADDPIEFARLEGEARAARARVSQLTRAKEEAERRADDAAHQLKLANARKLVDRCLKSLQQRDAIGAEVMQHARALAESYDRLMSHSSKTRDLLCGLIPEAASRSGFGLHSGEIAQGLAAEFWRLGLSLPQAEKPVRLDGVPEPYSEKNAPSLADSLAGCTAFATSILKGDRDYAGRQLHKAAEPKRSLLERFPWRKDRTALDEAREAGVAPIEALAQRAEHERTQIANALGIELPIREKGESDTDYLRRIDAMHATTRATDEEKAALHRPPTGPTKSAREIQAAIDAAGKYSTVIDARGAKPKEDW